MKKHARKLGAAAVVTLGLALQSEAILPVFDPAALLVNRLQDLKHGEINDLADLKIALQDLMLQHLPVSVRAAAQSAQRAIHQDLADVLGDLGPTGGSAIDQRYPLHRSEFGWLKNQQPQWDATERQELLAERELYDEVLSQMESVQDDVAQIVAASNGQHWSTAELPAMTATTQARNELLGVLSIELEKLLALHTASARRRTYQRAKGQAEDAHYRARSRVFWSDWPGNDSVGVSLPSLPLPPLYQEIIQ